MGMLHNRQQHQQLDSQQQAHHPPGPAPPPPPPRFYGDKIPNGGGDLAGEGDAKAAMVNGGGRVTLSR